MVTALLAALLMAPKQPQPSDVQVVKNSGGFQLMVDGKPFLIKGAGGDASKPLLVKCGGNSFRTWGADNIGTLLDTAQSLGLKVAVGIWLGHTEQGFHYDNPESVAKQYQSATEVIAKYKNHPAVLLWSLGNEMEGYGQGDDSQIWNSVEAIARYAKENDPHHPTMTVIAEVGGKKVPSLERYCPDIDIVGINSYGGGASVADRYLKAGGTKPFVLTEFGPPGVWELPKNSWGAAAEPTSTEKAKIYRTVYEKAVLGHPGLCLGSYAFAWGNKQEATATWFGMLLPGDTKLGAVDAMTELWSGKAPAEKCPEIESYALEGSDDVPGGSLVKAKIAVRDPQNSPFTVRWVLQRETAVFGVGGVSEAEPPKYPDAIVASDNTSVTVKMPSDSAGYRLFAYVKNSLGHGAVANLRLHVQPGASQAHGNGESLPFIVYADGDKPMPYVASGYMGDFSALKVNLSCTDHPHAGSSCIKVTLDEDNGWAGLAWQSPANDWGDKPGGYDLTGATKLTFWARGAQGDEKASFGVGLISSNKPYYDTSIVKSEGLVLGSEWKQYTISLADRDLKRIKTGFVIVLANSGQRKTIYLDDIRFEGP